MALFSLVYRLFCIPISMDNREWATKFDAEPWVGFILGGVLNAVKKAGQEARPTGCYGWIVADKKEAEQAPDGAGKVAAGAVAPGPQGQRAPRRASGQFRAGASGNPAGRPPGSRNRLSRECSDLLAAESGPIMLKLIRLAKKGDPVGIRLAVERLLPARASRDRFVTFTLPELRSAADLVDAAAAVIQHAAAGEISTSEAREFMALIEGQRKALETSEIVVRLEALECGRAGGSGAVGPDVRARVRRLIDESREPL
jgi:hypothetical protein